jgi:hypothetical protein
MSVYRIVPCKNISIIHCTKSRLRLASENKKRISQGARKTISGDNGPRALKIKGWLTRHLGIDSYRTFKQFLKTKALKILQSRGGNYSDWQFVIW